MSQILRKSFCLGFALISFVGCSTPSAHQYETSQEQRVDREPAQLSPAQMAPQALQGILMGTPNDRILVQAFVKGFERGTDSRQRPVESNAELRQLAQNSLQGFATSDSVFNRMLIESFSRGYQRGREHVPIQ